MVNIAFRACLLYSFSLPPSLAAKNDFQSQYLACWYFADALPAFELLLYCSTLIPKMKNQRKMEMSARSWPLELPLGPMWAGWLSGWSRACFLPRVEGLVSDHGSWCCCPDCGCLSFTCQQGFAFFLKVQAPWELINVGPSCSLILESIQALESLAGFHMLLSNLPKVVIITTVS